MKKIKRISEDREVKKIFSESQVIMLLEKMDDSIQLVAEGLMGLERGMGAGFEQANVRFKQLEANQNISLKHLFGVDDRLEAMEKELKEIKSELVSIGEKKLTPKENDSLSRRVEMLEKEMMRYRAFMKRKVALKSA